MSWTGAFGRACRVLLYAIVRGLSLTRINPNYLTFFGLVINIGAAVLFGYATAENTQRMFLYAGLTIIGAGIFDMVDGRVARATGQVTTFGAFFDSVIDRYSDLALFFGLLVYYARGNRFFYVVLVAVVMTGSVMVSYTRARAEALGATRIILQCGTAQPEAMAVYRRHGYAAIEPFGEYAEFESSRCFGRDLRR